MTSSGEKQVDDRMKAFRSKPIWKQYALRNSMKGTVTVRREPVIQDGPCSKSESQKKNS